jgi:adenosyl cobinamide kinase/adenosyl cobinamide phosphate guanylyltransferase
MSSTADRYLIANSNMSYVEFHHVATSQGIFCSSRSKASRIQNHKRRRRVVEWRMAKVIL